jgi:hypothetical protein
MLATRLQHQRQQQQQQQIAKQRSSWQDAVCPRTAQLFLQLMHPIFTDRPVLLKQRFGDEGEEVVLGCGSFVATVLPLLLPNDWVCHKAFCVLTMLLSPSEQPKVATTAATLLLIKPCHQANCGGKLSPLLSLITTAGHGA